MKKSLIKNLITTIGIIIIAASSRIIPHPPNFTSIGGLAIFSGIHFEKKSAMFIPLLAMLVSDLILGFHSTMLFVYASFLIIFFIGRMIRNKTNISKLISAGLVSSVLFFLITNFGVWLLFDMYAKNFGGLINCYLMGIPFFRNTILGDLFYTMAFFYGYRYSFVVIKKIGLVLASLK